MPGDGGEVIGISGRHKINTGSEMHVERKDAMSRQILLDSQGSWCFATIVAIEAYRAVSGFGGCHLDRMEGEVQLMISTVKEFNSGELR